MVSIAGLFTAALVAATLLPAQSEAVLAGMLIGGSHPVWLLLAVATAGNVLGSILNWAAGRYLMHFSDRSWFPVSRARLDRASAWYGKWGRWSLLGSWVPVIGDPLTLAAGVLREPLWRFALIVTIAKGGRYLAVAGIAFAAI
ncbi:YqaA family protein [Leisingera daeponensis]|uniref:YqaA family protein n=1 Tax=Leisingera daeponensis TaxID=405746 RepID=UPI001C93F065|nr:YqaA family protein [Leisingera daeponensis]MBY6058473.1 DedA family protein [Leisingera daeponensis]